MYVKLIVATQILLVWQYSFARQIRQAKQQAKLELITLGTKEYYFSNQANKLSWNAARDFCHSNGLEFGKIDSEEENRLVLGQAQRLYDRKFWGIWLGASDLSKEGQWIWESSKENLSFNKFDSDQPGGGTNENCLLLHRSDGRWNDFDCNRDFVFVCRKKPQQSAASTGSSLELVGLGSHEYYFAHRDNLLTWSLARDFCTSNGLEFGRIDSEDESRLVLGHAQKLYDRKFWGIWLGASDLMKEGEWVWANNKDKLNFQKFDSDQPGGGTNENCLLMHRSDGRWNDFNCDQQFVFICRRKGSGGVGSQLAELELIDIGRNKYYFSNREHKVPWAKAREFCRQNNLEFGSIQNARENGLILRHIQKLYERRLWGLWLGASDLNYEGHWVWDANPTEALKFSNWDDDQPGGGTDENCLLLHRSDGAWNDFNCSREFNFLCKKHQAEQVMLASTSNLNLVTLAGLQYYFSSRELSWNDARDFCQQHGLELTSIDSPQENRQIHAYMKKIHKSYSPWVGGTDEDDEGNWIWDATASKFSFENWWFYQPDGKSQENCLYLYPDDGKWGDRACSYHKPFICKKYE